MLSSLISVKQFAPLLYATSYPTSLHAQKIDCLSSSLMHSNNLYAFFSSATILAPSIETPNAFSFGCPNRNRVR